MRASTLAITVVLTGFIVSCSQAPPPEFGKADIDNIHKMIEEFVAVYNSKDAQKLSMFFTGDGLVMPPNASSVRGTENVREYYVKRFAQGASNLTLEPRDVNGVGTLAYASGDYRLTMAPPDGPARPDRGKFIFILREIKDRWQLDHLMFSSDFAVPQAGG